MMCDGCVFLSFKLKIDSILRVCRMMKKSNLHLVYVIRFFKNFQLSTSFALQKGRRIPSLGLSSNQWTGIITDDLIYQFREVSCFDEWLFDDFDFCFPIGGYSFARCKAPRIMLRFHLSGIADFQCTCNLPGFLGRLWWWSFPLGG